MTTGATPPQNTPEERLAALAQGKADVEARVAIKQAIHDGSVPLADVLAAGHRGKGDKVYGHIRVHQVLDAVPHMGPVKVAALLDAAGVADPDTHLDELTAQQVDALVAGLPTPSPTPTPPTPDPIPPVPDPTPPTPDPVPPTPDPVPPVPDPGPTPTP